MGLRIFVWSVGCRIFDIGEMSPGRTIALLLLAGCLAACDKQEPTLVVVVGGWGSNQLDDLRQAVVRECPQATVLSAGEWDGYKADLEAIIAENRHGRVVLVGHSLGCHTIARTAGVLPKVDLTVFIDPAWDDFSLPASVNRHLWYRRSGLGLERQANIHGAVGPRIIQGGHNSIAHSAELIDEVIAAINATKESGSIVASAGTR